MLAHFQQETNLDNIVDQLCTRLQDITDQDSVPLLGMPTCSIEQSEAVRKYYAAFPALRKGPESPLQYYLPPPAWCRKVSDNNIKMQSDLSVAKEWNTKNKKIALGKERRNSYHGQKKSNRKRYNSYSRSFESKECMPEWLTHEGVWDMEAQDPVREFIRAIALDEGYGTCENTVTDELRAPPEPPARVPDWDDGPRLRLEGDWLASEALQPRERTPMEEELYAQYTAKFTSSIEALWSKEQNTPDDEYQDLPIDFQDLLSSPSDHLFGDASAEKCCLISFTESIWSNKPECASRGVTTLPDRLRPLRIAERAPDAETFALYDGAEIDDAVSRIARLMESFAAINHSRDFSGFEEVPPSRAVCRPPPAPPAPAAPPAPLDREDLLTSSRTHFRPIKRESDEPPRYVDGDTFDIRGSLDSVAETRSESGGLFMNGERYLEYRAARTIDYGRLRLTAAQRCPDMEDPGFRLRFPLRQADVATQTEERAACGCGLAPKKMRPSEATWSAPAPCAEGEWGEAGAGAGAGEGEGGGAAGADRKRRHSAALRCGARPCAHPHARFLPCCAFTLDRPLTR